MQWKYIAKGYQKHPTRCKHQQWFFNPFAKKMTNRKTWPSTWTSKQNIWCQHTLPKYPKVKHGPWKATFPYLPNKRKVLFQLPTIMGAILTSAGVSDFLKRAHTHNITNHYPTKIDFAIKSLNRRNSSSEVPGTIQECEWVEWGQEKLPLTITRHPNTS